MKLGTRDVLLITMLGITLACGVAAIRVGKPLTMLPETAGMLLVFWQYYWGTKRGDVFMLWASLGLADLALGVAFYHEGLHIVAYPLAAAGGLIAVALPIVHRIKKGYYPGVLNWFSNKGLPKR